MMNEEKMFLSTKQDVLERLSYLEQDDIREDFLAFYYDHEKAKYPNEEAFKEGKMFAEVIPYDKIYPIFSIGAASDGELNFLWKVDEDDYQIHVDMGFYGEGFWSCYSHRIYVPTQSQTKFGCDEEKPNVFPDGLFDVVQKVKL